jgi:hypothetical protein
MMVVHKERLVSRVKTSFGVVKIDFVFWHSPSCVRVTRTQSRSHARQAANGGRLMTPFFDLLKFSDNFDGMLPRTIEDPCNCFTVLTQAHLHKRACACASYPCVRVIALQCLHRRIYTSAHVRALVIRACACLPGADSIVKKTQKSDVRVGYAAYETISSWQQPRGTIRIDYRPGLIVSYPSRYGCSGVKNFIVCCTTRTSTYHL